MSPRSSPRKTPPFFSCCCLLGSCVSVRVPLLLGRRPFGCMNPSIPTNKLQRAGRPGCGGAGRVREGGPSSGHLIFGGARGRWRGVVPPFPPPGQRASPTRACRAIGKSRVICVHVSLSAPAVSLSLARPSRLFLRPPLQHRGGAVSSSTPLTLKNPLGSYSLLSWSDHPRRRLVIPTPLAAVLSLQSKTQPYRSPPRGDE